MCRAVSNTNVIDGESFTTTTHIDSNYGRVKGTTYPNGLTVEYQFNDKGYLNIVKNAANDYIYQEIVSMDDWGKWNVAELANNGLLVERDYYEARGQMLGSSLKNGAGNTAFQSLSYEYDSYGDLTDYYVSLYTGTQTSLSHEAFVKV